MPSQTTINGVLHIPCQICLTPVPSPNGFCPGCLRTARERRAMRSATIGCIYGDWAGGSPNELREHHRRIHEGRGS